MAAEREMTVAGRMVLAHLHGGPDADTSELLDMANPRVVADVLAAAYAGILHTLGVEPDQVIPALIAERMRRVTLQVAT